MGITVSGEAVTSYLQHEHIYFFSKDAAACNGLGLPCYQGFMIMLS
jgi:hypothetical protein